MCLCARVYWCAPVCARTHVHMCGRRHEYNVYYAVFAYLHHAAISAGCVLGRVCPGASALQLFAQVVRVEVVSFRKYCVYVSCNLLTQWIFSMFTFSGVEVVLAHNVCAVFCVVLASRHRAFRYFGLCRFVNVASTSGGAAPVS